MKAQQQAAGAPSASSVAAPKQNMSLINALIARQCEQTSPGEHDRADALVTALEHSHAQ